MMKSEFFSDFLSSVTEFGRALLGRKDESADPEMEGLTERCEALISGRGEATGMAIARDVLDRFSSADQATRLAFFYDLAERFGVDQSRLRNALDAWKKDPSDERAAALHFASEPRRQELIRRLNRAPGGIATLVEMSAAVLSDKWEPVTYSPGSGVLQAAKSRHSATAAERFS